jgi:hypothetical protein
MSTHSVNVSIPVPSRRGVVAALVAALVAAGIALLIVSGGGSDQKSAAPKAQAGIKGTNFSGAGFNIGVPNGWHTLSPAARAGVPGRPLAVLQRADGHGLVVVRRSATPKDRDLQSLAKSLTAAYQKRYSDFSFVSARVERLRGGSAFLYTFLRTKSGTAQSVALTRTGGASFTIDSAVQSGDQRSAAEIAAIVRSFGP